MDSSILARYANMASFEAVPCWVGPEFLGGTEDETLLTVFFWFVQ